MRRVGMIVGGVLLVLVLVMVTGRCAPYNLYTHCGIRDAEFNGKQFYADPPLNDGNGNPPSGWANPTDTGFIVMKDPDTIEFIDWFGHHANFSTHPKSGIPILEICS